MSDYQDGYKAGKDGTAEELLPIHNYVVQGFNVEYERGYNDGIIARQGQKGAWERYARRKFHNGFTIGLIIGAGFCVGVILALRFA